MVQLSLRGNSDGAQRYVCTYSLHRGSYDVTLLLLALVCYGTAKFGNVV